MVTTLACCIPYEMLPAFKYKISDIRSRNQKSNIGGRILCCRKLFVKHKSCLFNRRQSQCPRTDLNKRFLPKPMTTTGWKGTHKVSKSRWIEIRIFFCFTIHKTLKKKLLLVVDFNSLWFWLLRGLLSPCGSHWLM